MQFAAVATISAIVIVIAIFILFSPPKETNGRTFGTSLYVQHCERCHGAIDSSEVSGHSSSQIQNAISNVNAMKSLSTLSQSQIESIAEALVP